jgi:hypothetical protein
MIQANGIPNKDPMNSRKWISRKSLMIAQALELVIDPNICNSSKLKHSNHTQ